MRLAFPKVLVLAVLLATCGQVMAGLQEGIDAIKSGDYALAEKEFRQLAKDGNALAQYHLGVMYDYGQGVPQNDKLALTWYGKAAARGYAKAQFRLGVMFDRGQGTRQSYPTALLWYRRAAMQGNSDAQNNLGVMYSSGQGVRQNLMQAYMWFSLAATSGNEVAVRNKRSVEGKMTPQEVESAQQLVRDWTAKQQ